MISSRSMIPLAVLVAFAMGCTSAAPVAPTTPAPSPSPTATGTGGRFTAHVLGGGTYPSYTVTALKGWAGGDPFIDKHAGGPLLGMSVWDVAKVPQDPCLWKGSLADPGPTVDDLVRALLAQKDRNATKPIDVTLGGYSGKYLEWSVPSDWVVTGDSDFKGCDPPGNGHHDFLSWLPTGTGERYQQMAGQVDRLWVLDVAGQRLVVDATHSPDASEADVMEQKEVVESLQFATP